jgi:hypothetical protein
MFGWMHTRTHARAVASTYPKSGSDGDKKGRKTRRVILRMISMRRKIHEPFYFNSRTRLIVAHTWCNVLDPISDCCYQKASRRQDPEQCGQRELDRYVCRTFLSSRGVLKSPVMAVPDDLTLSNIEINSMCLHEQPGPGSLPRWCNSGERPKLSSTTFQDISSAIQQRHSRQTETCPPEKHLGVCWRAPQ